MKIFIIVISLFAFPFFVHAQQTGSFQQTIVFDEPDYSFTRTLYFYVPTDYDPNEQYKLVVGFRGGPHSNAGQFRDQLKFLSDSIGAIILCPENAPHFNNQEGLTKQLFQYAVDTTMSMYNIDPDFVYLTGLSYGGRHAVIVSMDTDEGPIPNIRGVIPFASGQNSDEQPNYDDIADFPPACICIGLADSPVFITVSNNLHNDITSNGGNSMLVEIPGVGHTVQFATYPNVMMNCLNYIESQHQQTSINETRFGDKPKVIVVPNPASNEFELVYGVDVKPVKVYLVNTNGQIILNVEANQKRVNVSNLENGLAMLVVLTDHVAITRRVMIMH